MQIPIQHKINTTEARKKKKLYISFLGKLVKQNNLLLTVNKIKSLCT